MQLPLYNLEQIPSAGFYFQSIHIPARASLSLQNLEQIPSAGFYFQFTDIKQENFYAAYDKLDPPAPTTLAERFVA